MAIHQSNELAEQRQRIERGGGPPIHETGWGNKFIKPYAGLFVAIGLIALAFIAVWLWFVLS